MRLSKIRKKELVNLFDGARLGMLGDADLVINPKTGKIIAIEVVQLSVLGFRDKEPVTIPWSAVKKIGSDMIIVEVSRKIL